MKLRVLVAGVAAGSLLFTAAPNGQQQSQGRGRVGAIQFPTTPQVPDATRLSQTPAQPQQISMNPARMGAMAEARRRGLNYVPGEVLVKFRDGVSASDQTRAVQAAGNVETADTFERAGRVAVIHNDAQPDPYVLADQLRGQPEVEYAEPNYIVSMGPVGSIDSPTPPAPAKQTLRSVRGSVSSIANGVPTDNDYNAYQWNFQLINMPGAWDIQPGGRSDLIVAVLDSGVTTGNGSITTPIWTNSGFQTTTIPYATNSDLSPSRLALAKNYIGTPFVDMSGHGTHVSSTIAEDTNNGFLVAGMAYNVKIMPLKICESYWDEAISRAQSGLSGFPSGYESSIDCFANYADIANGINYAVANGARVMNISFGGNAPNSNTLRDALINAAAQGAFVSISMGNAFLKGNPTSYPAAYAASIDGVMSVGSVGPNSTKASYSSTGPHCEIAAPGGDDVGNSGRIDFGYVWQSTISSSDHPLFASTARFDRYNKIGYIGTSMAAPHVAGLAALLMSQNPALTGAQIERIIKATAKDLGSPGKDDSFGYGLIQPRAALFGFGIRK